MTGYEEMKGWDGKMKEGGDEGIEDNGGMKGMIGGGMAGCRSVCRDGWNEKMHERRSKCRKRGRDGEKDGRLGVRRKQKELLLNGEWMRAVLMWPRE